MADAVTALEAEQSVNGAVDVVLKSGPLFISSKALGWKSWKKRWFILTKTSLVFFRSDPSIIVQGGGELNLTLGGIDLNKSASVIVREDKKLLTILFPDGQDGRGFTLKTETSEDLHEWRTALEHAFTQAPCVAPVTVKDGIMIDDVIAGSFYHWKDNHSVKSQVLGSPISLALRQADGGPSFLEKALCFLEEFGTKVVGILRISADVEEVQRRIQEFEQGKTEFDVSEDAHVVGDCVKHIIRELPTSLVPICCCNELLKAYEIDQYEAQMKAFRMAILKNLPSPNKLLFQRILKMMYTISCTPENHMTPSAVAACMAPLLLQPILAGECNLKDDVEFSDEDSAQLLAAAYAAKTAQAIITLVLEEYQYIFSDEKSTRYTISADLEKDEGDEESTAADILEKKNIENLEAKNIISSGKDENSETLFSDELSSSTCGDIDLYDNMDLGPNLNLVSGSCNLSSSESQHVECNHAGGSGSQSRKIRDHYQIGNKTRAKLPGTFNTPPIKKLNRSVDPELSSLNPKLPSSESESCAEKSIDEPASSLNRKTSSLMERVSAKKICSMESLDSPAVEKLDVRQLEMKMVDLQRRLAKEAKVNEFLQASLERRMQALLERRLILRQDVEKLQEQLKAERDLRLAVEVGLSPDMSSGKLSIQGYVTTDEKEEIAIAEADVARLKQKVAALHHQLSRQQELYGFPSDAPYQNQHAQNIKPRQRSLQQDFNATLETVNYERMQKMQGISAQSDGRTVEGTQSVSSTRSQMDRRKLVNLMSIHNPVSREVSCNGIDTHDRTLDAPLPYRDFKLSHSQGSSPAFSTLAELANRVSFFRNRESQLIKQWQNLDVQADYTPARDAVYLSPSQ